MEEKIKPYYNLFIIIIIAIIFFALGRLSVNKAPKDPLKISYTIPLQSATVMGSQSTTTENQNITTTTPPQDGPVIGSKSGKKYYFPWCGTVKRIKPENQVHFNSITEAKEAGFTAGGNCKGLN